MTVDQQLFVFIIIKSVHYYLSLFNLMLFYFITRLLVVNNKESVQQTNVKSHQIAEFSLL